MTNHHDLAWYGHIMDINILRVPFFLLFYPSLDSDALYILSARTPVTLLFQVNLKSKHQTLLCQNEERVTDMHNKFFCATERV